MPKFDVVSMDEAMLKTTSGRRSKILLEYVNYIQQLKEDEAGRLVASQEESATAVRRRLGAAAKLAGKELTIKRNGDEVYFWTHTKDASAPRRRRGRPRKTQQG